MGKVGKLGSDLLVLGVVVRLDELCSLDNESLVLMLNMRFSDFPAVDSLALLDKHLDCAKVLNLRIFDQNFFLCAELTEIKDHESRKRAELHWSHLQLSFLVLVGKERGVARVNDFDMSHTRIDL